jgi:hypothetical protein
MRCLQVVLCHHTSATSTVLFGKPRVRLVLVSVSPALVGRIDLQPIRKDSGPTFLPGESLMC